MPRPDQRWSEIRSFGVQGLNNIDARGALRRQRRRDYRDNQQHKGRGGHRKNARHRYVREIAACHARQDESEYRASHDARGSHCGAFRDDILVKSLWLGAKRQPDAELPRARADGKCEHACDTDYRNRQCDRGEHAKHHRIQTMRTEHRSAVIFERSGVLTGLSRGHVTNNARDRRHQRIGIYTRVDEQTAAKQWTLFKGIIDGERALRDDMHIVNIRGDANDALQLRRGLARDFQDWIGPEHVLIDGVLTGEYALREGLADDGDGFFVLNVEFVQIAPRNDGNAQRLKAPGRDTTKLRARVVFTRGINVTVSAELQAGTRTGIAPGSDHPEGGLIDTWKGINATYDFLVKIDNLLACLSIKDGGDVDGKDVARVHAGLRPLQCEESSDQHTRAGQQHE